MGIGAARKTPQIEKKQTNKLMKVIQFQDNQCCQSCFTAALWTVFHNTKCALLS